MSVSFQKQSILAETTEMQYTKGIGYVKILSRKLTGFFFFFFFKCVTFEDYNSLVTKH